jgi:segregation and condensation protein B
MNEELQLQAKIEGLLFYKNEDIPIAKLAELLKASYNEIVEALLRLDQALVARGLVLIRKDDRVMLGTAPELSPLIESIRKEEITKELSKASLETLSIILYKDGVARSEIDYIRGVNSSFILRNLLVRGLIEKTTDEKDSRRILYKPTFDTLSYMGVASVDALPNYAEVKMQLETTISQSQNTND